jgi:hypothetical protein
VFFTLFEGLDFAGGFHEKNTPVPTFTANFYCAWRECRRPLWSLNEQAGVPAERLLQAVWHHQRLQREKLNLCDGRAVRILHPGFWNREAGPDFRGAVVQVEGEAAQTGDIEVDLHSRCWRQHGHDRNPAFGKVVLHVVWEAEAQPPLPTLALKPFLDAPLPELASWLGTDAAESFPKDLQGRCAAPLGALASEKWRELLRQAALARLQRKAGDLEARARQAGWEQALWEGLWRALGYKHNAWPMLRLGELRPVLCVSQPLSLLQWQARLFGVSGLLPAELGQSTGADGYLRRLWDCWWRERDQFSDFALPSALWRLHGLRPANHPLRRLALGAHWWAAGTIPARLESWFTSAVADKDLEGSLLATLQAPEDEFWSWHWTLRGRRLDKPQPLLGPTRVTDLAVNVLLPWFWVRARHGNNPALQAEAERRYLAWPAAQDNTVLRLARQRLAGGVPRRGWNSAALQQGLLQIVRDFCDHSDPLCSECPFPECVHKLGALGSGDRY